MSTEPRRIKKLIRKPAADSSQPTRESLNKRGVQHEYTCAPAKTRKVTGFITLTQLAAARSIQPQLARLWVLKAGIKKPAEGWRWRTDAKILPRIRKVLGLAV